MKPENRALLIGHDSRTYRGSPEETEAKGSSVRARFPHIAPRLGRNHEDGQFWSGQIPGDSHAFVEEAPGLLHGTCRPKPTGPFTPEAVEMPPGERDSLTRRRPCQPPTSCPK